LEEGKVWNDRLGFEITRPPHLVG